MKEFSLNGGFTGYVSDEDFELISKYNWWAHKNRHNVYAKGRINKKLVFMHHLILGKPPEGMVTDHKDRNGLNNQRENIWFCSQSENMYNKRKVPIRTKSKIVYRVSKLGRPYKHYVKKTSL